MTSAAIRRTAPPPTPEELIRRARDLVPEIRALAEETERNRKISPVDYRQNSRCGTVAHHAAKGVRRL